MLYAIENLINTYDSPTDYADLSLEILKVLTIEAPFTEEEFRSMSKEDLVKTLDDAAMTAFERKSERIREVAMPVVKDCVENRGYQGRIMVPITDGKRIFNLPVDLMEAYNTECRSIVKEWHKAILLVTIDELWKEHLRELDQLRQSVQNVSYEQKDPLVIYKVESFHLFEQMLNNLNIKVISALMRGQIYIQQRPAEPRATVSATAQNDGQANAQQEETKQEAAPAAKPQPEIKRAMPERPTDYSNLRTSRENLPGENAQRAAANAPQGEKQKPMPIKASPRIGRNDPCPCGSGKKYKNCHGKNV